MIDIDERYVEKKSFFNRLLVVYIFFGIAFSFFLYQTYSLQISEYTNYESASIKNKTKEVLVQPVRGIIYDRNGNIIVKNVPTYDLILKPSQVISIENFLNSISEIIDFNESEFDYIKENFAAKASLIELVIKKDLSMEEIAKFEVRSFRFPYAFIDVRYSRINNYPYLFHAVGYVGGPSNEEIENIFRNQDLAQIETIFKYSNGFQIGKTGLENTYDDSLRGKFGKRFIK